MKKWLCTTCNNIQTTDTLPEKCPICWSEHSNFELINESLLPNQFADVLIIGSGAGALAAATTAVAEGANIIVLEKGKNLGGTTKRSGGRYWIPNNYLMRAAGIKDEKEDALAYMCRYSYPNKYNPSLPKFGLTNYEYEMIENYYDHASLMTDYFKDMDVFESFIDVNWKGEPHVDYLQNISENKNIRGRSIYALPKSEKSSPSGGVNLINNFVLWLESRQTDIRKEHQVIRVLTDQDENVIGVVAKTSAGLQNFYGKKGVIFGTGGFSHNQDLIKRFHAHQLIGGCGVPENTGDLVPIAESLGAMLGNMTNAFRIQSIFEKHLENPGLPNSTFFFIGDSFLEVNKYGKRVVNEKRNYNDRTLAHYEWDAVRAEYPNQFLFFVTDQRAVNYWGGFPPYPKGDLDKQKHIIQGNTLEELADNIDKKLNDIKEHIGNFKLEPDFKENLIETVNRFNQFAKDGKDLDFLRGSTDYDVEYPTMPPFNPKITWPEADSKNVAMYPLANVGPYFAIIMAPGSLDTNGGPMTNKHGQFLRDGYIPIKGIYGAGNCIASPGMNSYWGAGATIGPAMTYGYLSAKHALRK